MLARKRTREFQPGPFCFGIFLPATRSRIARRNFSRSAGLSMSSLRFIASAYLHIGAPIHGIDRRPTSLAVRSVFLYVRWRMARQFNEPRTKRPTPKAASFLILKLCRSELGRGICYSLTRELRGFHEFSFANFPRRRSLAKQKVATSGETWRLVWFGQHLGPPVLSVIEPAGRRAGGHISRHCGRRQRRPLLRSGSAGPPRVGRR